MSEDREKITARIKKLLALSASPNAAEAAAALAKAQELMARYDISETAVQVADVEEARATAGARWTPAEWENYLSRLVCRAFGVGVVFTVGAGRWLFFGPRPAHEVAAYAFDVLRRKIVALRREHVAGLRKGVKQKTKIRRGDLFCIGFIAGVSEHVHDFAGGAERMALLEAYKSERWGDRVGSLKTRRRPGGQRASDERSSEAGYAEGERTRLRHGVGGSEGPRALPGL